MRIGIMQPYFFPYLGYFSLIKHTDRFILLDTVQFIRHGWIERNRILKQNKSWLYIKVPIIRNKGRSTTIKDIKIDNNQNWKQKILSQIQPYKKYAPNYFEVVELLNELFSKQFYDITTLNKESLELVCNYLNISNNICVFSQIGLSIEEVKEPDEWALNICKALGNVKEYWNPSGKKELFDKNKYLDNGIDLKFLELNIQKYNQRRDVFEPGLSIIDVMMFNTPKEINKMLDDYKLL